MMLAEITQVELNLSSDLAAFLGNLLFFFIFHASGISLVWMFNWVPGRINRR